jgi:hypothetical protein
MDKEQLAKLYAESIEYNNNVIEDFWKNLPEKQKNDYIKAADSLSGRIDWMAKITELVLDPPSMGRFIEIFQDNVLSRFPKALERWNKLSTQDKVLSIITLFKYMDEHQKERLISTPILPNENEQKHNILKLNNIHK